MQTGCEEKRCVITIFFSIRNVNISPATRGQIGKPSAAYFAIVPCMLWEISAAAASGIRRTGSRIAATVCDPTAGKISKASAMG